MDEGGVAAERGRLPAEHWRPWWPPNDPRYSKGHTRLTFTGPLLPELLDEASTLDDDCFAVQQGEPKRGLVK